MTDTINQLLDDHRKAMREFAELNFDLKQELFQTTTELVLGDYQSFERQLSRKVQQFQKELRLQLNDTLGNDIVGNVASQAAGEFITRGEVNVLGLANVASRSIAEEIFGSTNISNPSRSQGAGILQEFLGAANRIF